MRRVFLGITVVLLGLSFLAGAHYYIAKRLILDPGLHEPWRSAGLLLLLMLAISLVLQPIGERKLRPPTSRWISWPASIWMGVAFLVLMQLLVSDAVLAVVGGVAKAAGVDSGSESSIAALRAVAVVAVSLVAAAIGLRNGLRPPMLERVKILLERWPAALDGFRIVQITDIHIGPLLDRRFAQHLVERVNALDADLVAVTGDLVDGSARLLRDEVEPFSGLRGRYGVYFVTGNHDHYSGASAWSERARELGMRVLRNERVEIRVGHGGDADRDRVGDFDPGGVFDLVGVDDHRGDVFGREGGEDLDAALSDRDPDRPAVLLAHDPSTFKRAFRMGIDLQISGHTHGGQIWPFHWFVRLVIPFIAGRYRRGSAELYVSRGTGFWGPPMRLGSSAEITEITLCSRSKA